MLWKVCLKPVPQTHSWEIEYVNRVLSSIMTLAWHLPKLFQLGTLRSGCCCLPGSYAEIPIPIVMVLGGGIFGKWLAVLLSWLGLVSLSKRPHRAPLPLPAREDTTRRWQSTIPKRTLTRTPDPGLPASRMVSNKPLLFYKQPSNLCYFVVKARTN